MKKLLLVILSVLFFFDITQAIAGGKGGGAVSVKGYFKNNGTYVAPHYRSAPDGNFNNNWSTKGNINPYTGEEGTKVTPPNNQGIGLPGQSTPNSTSTNVGTPEPSNKSYNQIKLPPNAELDVYGTGWKCRRGYHQSDGACVSVTIPPNAELDVYGTGWKCRRGYHQSDGACVPMNN